MSYNKLTRKQLFSGEVSYTLDDFAKDFRKEVINVWGRKRLDTKNGQSNTLFQGLLLIIIFASQGKSLWEINEVLLGKNTKDLEDNLGSIVKMYEKEIKILEGLQMNMFLENLKKYHLSDSLNLQLLNTNFREWFVKIMEPQD
jgi:hypothetical protein